MGGKRSEGGPGVSCIFLGKTKKIKKKDGRGVGTSRRSWCDGVEGNRVVGVKFIFAGLEQPHCIHLFFSLFFACPHCSFWQGLECASW